MRRRLFRACWKKRSVKTALIPHEHPSCVHTASVDLGRLDQRPTGVYRRQRKIRNDFAEADAQRAFENLHLVGRRLYLSPPIHSPFLRGPV